MSQVVDTSKVGEELIQEFNNNARKGMRMLMEQGVVQDTPNAIAEFLHTAPIKKRSVGEFLSSTSSENLKAFVEYLDFTNVEFVPAMRTFLDSLTLPGEARQIDRILEVYATWYYQCNQTLPTDYFADADVCYIMCFSLIMLNTDLSSPLIKRKITLEQFVVNCVGLNNGTDLDRVFLEHVYTSIQQHPFELKETAFGECKKRGYLQRKTSFLFWRKFWFMVTTDQRLYIFKNDIEGYNDNALGYIDLENVHIETSENSGKFVIEISPAEEETRFLSAFQYGRGQEVVEDRISKLVLAASTLDQMEDWCEALVGNFKTSNQSNKMKSARK